MPFYLWWFALQLSILAQLWWENMIFQDILSYIFKLL